tara:strand:- start:1876 stop:2019 length:144 start_codon:yes stop_codon:yes gene_type:complete
MAVVNEGVAFGMSLAELMIAGVALSFTIAIFKPAFDSMENLIAKLGK